jgi:hypothetical protein
MRGQFGFWKSPAVVGLMNQMALGVMRANTVPRALWETSPKITKPKSGFYSFFFYDHNNQLILGEDRECDSIASAIACGHELLAFGDYQKIEVWVKNARVGLVQKKTRMALGSRSRTSRDSSS